jgi:hypothetical protein
MNEFKKILAASIVSSLICCLLFWLLIERKKISKAQFDLVTSHTEYIKDTNTYRAVIDNTTTINNPVRIIERAIPFNAPVDSLAIYKSYYNRYVYTRNFDDTLLSWTMVDTVSENRFSPFSKMSYKLKRPITTTINNYAPAKRFNLYAGMRGSYAANKFEFTPVVGVVTKTKWIFDIGYNPNKKELQASAYYTLLK